MAHVCICMYTGIRLRTHPPCGFLHQAVFGILFRLPPAASADSQVSPCGFLHRETLPPRASPSTQTSNIRQLSDVADYLKCGSRFVATRSRGFLQCLTLPKTGGPKFLNSLAPRKPLGGGYAIEAPAKVSLVLCSAGVML